MPSQPTSEERTLLEWAARQHPESSRKRLKEWFTAGRFTLHGEVVRQAGLRMPDPGAALQFGAPEEPERSALQQKRIHPQLKIVYLDDTLAVVDKGAGLLSVPAAGRRRNTSALQLLAEFIQNPRNEPLRRRLFGRGKARDPLPVHRLDQYTTGLLCFALTPDARAHLIEQLRAQDLKRVYLALAEGVPAPKQGTWRHFLELTEDGYSQVLHEKAVEGAVEAVTHYSVETVFQRGGICRLRLELESGLKHQIRIQAAAAGAPLVGDRLYNERVSKARKLPGSPLPFGFKRQALHAHALELTHPVTGKPLRCTAPLPPDMQALQERIQGHPEA